MKTVNFKLLSLFLSVLVLTNLTLSCSDDELTDEELGSLKTLTKKVCLLIILKKPYLMAN